MAKPFQLSLRARLCPIWLFPRAGKPQVAMTTPANLRDDFATPGILAAIFSLGSKEKEYILRTLYRYLCNWANRQHVKIAFCLRSVFPFAKNKQSMY